MEVARRGEEASLDDKVKYRRDGFFSVRMCLEAVDILMTIAGSGGLLTSGSLQRLFRDAHAANAHQMFSPDIQALIFGQQELGAVAAPPEEVFLGSRNIDSACCQACFELFSGTRSCGRRGPAILNQYVCPSPGGRRRRRPTNSP